MKYGKSDVLAVIVSYNPTSVLIENIRSLSEQVEEIIVLDNGSSQISSEIFTEVNRNNRCNVIYNDQNTGIASRLNEAISIAKKKGYKLLLSMDQDTVLEENCVDALVEVLNTDPNVVSVGPKRNNNYPEKDFYYKEYLITSGNLVLVEVLEEVKGYIDEMFIDMVDIDISLAIRKKGYKIAISNKAKMKHNVGDMEKNKLAGHIVSYRSHGANRYYYIYRNLMAVNRIYFKYFSVFIIKLNITHLGQLVKLVIEKDGLNKLMKAISGFRDRKMIGIIVDRRRGNDKNGDC